MPDSKTQQFPQGTTEFLPNPGYDDSPDGHLGANFGNLSSNFPVPDQSSFLGPYMSEGIGLRQKMLSCTVLPEDYNDANAYYGTTVPPIADLVYNFPRIAETPADLAAVKHNMYAPNLLPPDEPGTAFTAIADNPIKVTTYRMGKNNLPNTPLEYRFPFGPRPNDTSEAVKSNSNRNLPNIDRVRVVDGEDG